MHSLIRSLHSAINHQLLIACEDCPHSKFGYIGDHWISGRSMSFSATLVGAVHSFQLLGTTTLLLNLLTRQSDMVDEKMDGGAVSYCLLDRCFIVRPKVCSTSSRKRRSDQQDNTVRLPCHLKSDIRL